MILCSSFGALDEDDPEAIMGFFEAEGGGDASFESFFRFFL
jgi:hypothetical protein